MRRLAACILALGLAAVAAPPAGATEKTPGKEELQAVELAAVGLPIVWRGKLVNYVFTYIRLPTSASADLAKARTKEPYFRDALIRAAHRTPFTDPHDLTKLNEAALKAALLPAAQRIAGPGVVTGVVVVSQTPQRRFGLPDVSGGATPARAPIP